MKSNSAITWKHWFVGGIIIAFSVYDLYCAHVYGQVYVRYLHWITFTSHHYWYAFSLTVGIACLVLVGIGVVTWLLEGVFELNVRRRWRKYERFHSRELSRTRAILRPRRRTTAAKKP